MDTQRSVSYRKALNIKGKTNLGQLYGSCIKFKDTCFTGLKLVRLLFNDLSTILYKRICFLTAVRGWWTTVCKMYQPNNVYQEYRNYLRTDIREDYLPYDLS